MNRSLPKVHSLRILLLQRRAQLCEKQSDQDGAAHALQAALKLADQIWPAKTPLHAQLNYELAHVLKQAGKGNAAVAACRESLAIRKQGGAAAADLRRSHVLLAQLLRHRETSEAVENMELALGISRAALPHSATLFAQDAALLGRCLQEDSRLGQTVEVATEALATISALGTESRPLHEERVLLLFALGGFQKQLGNYSAARVLFDQLISHYQSHPPTTDEDRGVLASSAPKDTPTTL